MTRLEWTGVWLAVCIGVVVGLLELAFRLVADSYTGTGVNLARWFE